MSACKQRNAAIVGIVLGERKKEKKKTEQNLWGVFLFGAPSSLNLNGLAFIAFTEIGTHTFSTLA